MPAAAWAARSGDAALPVRRDRIPAPIVGSAARAQPAERVRARAGERDLEAGPDQLEKQKLARDVNRIEGPNAGRERDRFARYEKGDFGWGVVVPGYNFTLASDDAAVRRGRRRRARHARGVRAAPPERRPGRLPAKLEEYFLSVQPGYEDDPGQAVYNRAGSSATTRLSRSTSRRTSTS